MSKNSFTPIKHATLSVNVAGYWYSRTVDSPVMAYACAFTYIDGVLDHPDKGKEDRIVIKEKIMRAVLDVFDGKREGFAQYGIQLDPVNE